MSAKYRKWNLNIGDLNSTGFVLVANGPSVQLKDLPIEVIEVAALDRAVGLLTRARMQMVLEDDQNNLCYQIIQFLKSLETEGV